MIGDPRDCAGMGSRWDCGLGGSSGILRIGSLESTCNPEGIPKLSRVPRWGLGGGSTKGGEESATTVAIEVSCHIIPQVLLSQLVQSRLFLGISASLAFLVLACGLFAGILPLLRRSLFEYFPLRVIVIM